ncbi:methylated-DNA--[protein]-cysteine S-methyltransferase [Streptomyces glaucosporus]
MHLDADRRAFEDVPAAGVPGAVSLRLPHREPLFPDSLFGHLAATAVPGVEEWRDGAYRRTVRLPHGHGTVALRPGPAPGREPDGEGRVDCRLVLSDMRDLSAAVGLCRRLLDLDADPLAVDAHLGGDPLLAPLVARAPGRRVPGTADPAEFAVRAVLGQQVSTAAARTLAGRLVRAHGEAVHDPEGGLTHLFPEPAALAEMDPGALAMPRTRRATLLALVSALASGEIDLGPGSDRRLALARLAALPGVGPWTVETIAMRALGDPDAFVATDLGVRLAARALGLPSSPGALTRRAGAWRPWRAYAVQHLWATGDHPINRLPDRLPDRGPPSTAARPAREDTPMTIRAPARRRVNTVVDSPYGPLTLVAEEGRLIGLYMERQRHRPPEESFGERDGRPFGAVEEQLGEYFAGQRTAFDLPLDLRGTPFQRTVWNALLEIPYGETVSYGRLAERIGRPAAARAVGLANGRNPVGIIVPCHRVVGSTGDLTGYGGGVDRKRRLLDFERRGAGQLVLPG